MNKFIGADRVYRKYVDAGVYFIEKDGKLICMTEDGEYVECSFAIKAGWHVWRVDKDGNLVDRKTILV